MNRRAFLTGLIAAPAVIRTPGLLMPVRTWLEPDHDDIWLIDWDGARFPGRLRYGARVAILHTSRDVPNGATERVTFVDLFRPYDLHRD